MSQSLYAGQLRQTKDASFDTISGQVSAQANETVAGTGAGKDAMDANVALTLLDTSAGTSDLTLGPGGAVGQVKNVLMTVAGNAAVMDTTDCNLIAAVATITFDAVGEFVSLVWTGSEWAVASATGATIA